jgi:hypothetical protein
MLVIVCTGGEGTSHKNRNDLVIPEEKNRSQERGRVFSICEKQVVICGRKEKHQYKIEHGLNLRRRRKEKRSVRIRSLTDLKGNSPDRFS